MKGSCGGFCFNSTLKISALLGIINRTIIILINPKSHIL